jgi:hypothetical protein
MPKRKSKTAKKVKRAFHKIYHDPGAKRKSRKQKIAIALSEARRKGARIPKK